MTNETPISVDSLQKQVDELRAKAQWLSRTSVALAALAAIALGFALHSPDHIECDSLRASNFIEGRDISTRRVTLVDPNTWKQSPRTEPFWKNTHLSAGASGELNIHCDQLIMSKDATSRPGIHLDVSTSKPRVDFVDSEGRPSVQIAGGPEPSIGVVLGRPEARRTVIDGDGLVIKRGEEGLALWWGEGRRQDKGNYKNGKKEGHWTVWNKDSTLNTEKSGVYKADKKVADLPKEERADPPKKK